MFKNLKFKTDKQGIFFSSDWHVYHDRPWVVADMGYEDIAERAAHILDSVNSTVGAEDILFYLGDGFLNSTCEMAAGFMNSINCKTICYIWGNHEGPLGQIYKKDMAEIQERAGLPGTLEIYPWKLSACENVVVLGNYQTICVDKKPVVLSHFPMDVFDRQQHGGYMLCGHSHYNYEKTRADYSIGRRLDVGWDGHKKILSWEDIRSAMSGKASGEGDHHTPS